MISQEGKELKVGAGPQSVQRQATMSQAPISL
jgi:hypothetical protein